MSRHSPSPQVSITDDHNVETKPCLSTVHFRTQTHTYTRMHTHNPHTRPPTHLAYPSPQVSIAGGHNVALVAGNALADAVICVRAFVGAWDAFKTWVLHKCVCVRLYVRVCVCVCERERVCVCVLMSVYRRLPNLLQINGTAFALTAHHGWLSCNLCSGLLAIRGRLPQKHLIKISP